MPTVMVTFVQATYMPWWHLSRFSGPKCSWTKLVWTQIFVEPKKFSWPQIFLRPKIFLWTQRNFRTQFFFDPKFFSNQKFVRTQNELQLKLKTIFRRRNQSFWTWGFLNRQGQRFYFNWSLTLMTKSLY